jgi:flagellar biosynthetic protein FlhB
LAETAVELLAVVTGIAAIIAVVVFLWQQQSFISRNRMSHEDLKRETKESEGDPYMKQSRQKRGREIANNRMLMDVPTADVVVTNPEHYAVALKWSRMPGSAPECVAKGEDEIAAAIRKVAAQSGVPIHQDPPTARSLYAAVQIGEEIRVEHYHAVAAAIRFSEEMRTKARQRTWR